MHNVQINQNIPTKASAVLSIWTADMHSGLDTIVLGLNTLYIYSLLWDPLIPLRWRHDGRDSVSNHQPHHCLLNRLFRRRSKKASKLRVTGLCGGNSPGTGDFPAQMASNAENVSIWWRHRARRPPYSSSDYQQPPWSLQSGYGVIWIISHNKNRVLAMKQTMLEGSWQPVSFLFIDGFVFSRP